jgi:hypothetical protein
MQRASGSCAVQNQHVSSTPSHPSTTDLARRLRDRDLSVFFSEDAAPPGEPLSDTLKRALRRSKLLVVIVNRATAACALAGRTLTLEAWRRHIGDDRPYAPACRLGSSPAR